MAGWCKAFHTIRQGYNDTFIRGANDGTLMHGINGKHGFKHIPRVLFQLFVSKAQSAVFLVDIQHNHLDAFTDLGKLCRVLDFLAPGKVADVNQAIYTFFKLNKDSKVGKVPDCSCGFCADGILLMDVFPWIRDQLFDAE